MELDNRKRIAIDMDGTLTEKPRFPDIWNITPTELWEQYVNSIPKKEIIEWVNKKYDEGNLIYIFTSRTNMFQKVTKDWLDNHGVKYHYIIMDKPYYDLFLDDKAIRPEEING